MALAGFAYVAFVLPRILKARSGMAEQITGGAGKQFIAQIDIGYGHPLAGAEAVAGMFPALKDMTVRLVQRREHPFLPPFENLTLAPGDTLVVAATRTALTRAISDRRSSGSPTDSAGTPTIPTKDLTLAEAVVAPGSRLIGRTIEQAAIHQRHRYRRARRRAAQPHAAHAACRHPPGSRRRSAGRRHARRDRGPAGPTAIFCCSNGRRAELPRRRYARRAQVIFALMVDLCRVAASGRSSSARWPRRSP